MTALLIACFTSLFLVTWSVLDILLVWITSMLVNNTELVCDKQYAPQRIAVIGPPESDQSLSRSIGER